MSTACLPLSRDWLGDNVMHGTLTPAAPSAVADGISAIELVIVARDDQDQAKAGAKISLSCLDANLSWSTPAPTDANGRTQARLTAKAVGSYEVTASARFASGDVSPFPAPATVTFVRAKPSPQADLRITFLADPADLSVDTAQSVLLTLSVEPLGALPAGTAVEVTGLLPGDSLVPLDAGVGPDGLWHATYNGRRAGIRGLRAVVATLDGSTAVTWRPGAIVPSATTVIVDDSDAHANGGAGAQLTASVVDQYGNGVPNAPVSWSVSDANVVISPNVSLTDDAGLAYAVAQSALPGDFNVAAVQGNTAIVQPLRVLPALPDAAHSFFIDAGGPTTADGASQANAQVTLLDGGGSPVFGVPVHFSSSDANLVFWQSDATSDASGVARVAASSTRASSFPVVATTATTGLSISGALVFVAGPLSANRCSLSVQPGTVLASNDLPSTATFCARDAFDNPVANANVFFATSGISTQVVPATTTTSNDGNAAVTLGSIVAQQQNIVASVGGLLFAVPWQVRAAAPQANTSTLVLQPTMVAVNQRITLTATLADAFGNVAEGQNVMLSAASGSASLSPSGAITDGNGQVVSQVRFQEIGQWSVLAQSGALSLSANVVVTAASPNASLSALSASPASGVADGNSGVTLCARVCDAYGNPIAAMPVTFSSTASQTSFVASQGNTDSTGQYCSTLVSTQAGNQVVQAAFAGVTLLQNVPFGPGPVDPCGSTLSLSPNTQTVGGSMSVMVLVRDAHGNAVDNVPISLSTSGSRTTFLPPTGQSDANGTWSASVTSQGAQVQSVQASLALVGNLTAQATWQPGEPNATLSTLVISPAVLAAGSNANVLATVRDEYGNEVAGANVSVSADGSLTNIVPAAGTTDATGQFTATVTTSAQQNQTLSATAAGATWSTALEVQAASPQSAASSVTLVPATVTADGLSAMTISLQVRDAYGNGVGNQSVSVSASGQNNLLSPTTLTTDAAGQANATLQSTVAENKTVSFVAAAASGSATAAFVAGAANTTSSSLTLTPNVTLADNAQSINVAVRIADAFGNPVGNQLVSLSSSGTGDTFAPGAGVTDDAGSFSSSLTSSVAQSKTITATADLASLSATATFEAVPPDSSNSSLVGSPNGPLVADNTQSYTLTATIADASGTPISGEALHLTVFGGAVLSVTDGNTNAAGQLTSLLRSTTLGSKTVTMTAGGASAVNSFVFVAGAANANASVLTLSPNTQVADNIQSVSAAVRLADVFGNPVANQMVSASSSGTANTLSPSSGVTDGNGRFAFTLKSTVAEAKTVAATSGNLTLSQVATFIAGAASSANCALTASPNGPLTADNNSTYAVVATVADAYGNRLKGQAVHLSASGNAVLSVTDGNTNGFGQLTSSMRSRLSGLKTVSMTAGSASANVTLRFVAGAPNSTLSSLTLTPSTQTADDVQTIGIALRVLDAFGNPIANQNVSLSSSGTANTLSPSSGATDSNGAFLSSQKSSVAEAKTILATAGNLTLSQTANFTAGAASSANCTLASSPNGPLTANNSSSYTLLATVADSYGNRLFGQSVHFAATGNAILSLTDGNTNSSGQLTTSLRSSGSGAKTVSMTASAASANATVSFVAGAPNGTLSSLTLTPNTQVADDTQTVGIGLRVLDAFGNPVSNQSVSFSSSGTANTLSPLNGVTDSNGSFYSSQKSSYAETKTILATAGNLTLSQAATFTAGIASSASCSLTASPNGPLSADNNSAYSLVATVADAYGNRIAGQSVHLSATGNALLSVTDGNTNSSGQLMAFLRSRVAGPKSVLLAAGPASANATLGFVAGAPNATLSSLTLTPNTQVADNAQSVAVALKVVDAFNNPTANQNVSLTSSGTANTLSPANGVTDGNGIFSSSQKSSMAEAKTLFATIGNLTLSQNVTFIAGAASSANCSLVSSPNGPLTADNNAAYTLVATVADAYGNRLNGQSVHLSATGSVVLSVTDGNTNGAGQLTSLVRSSTAGSKTLSMTAGAGSANATLSFVAGAPNNTSSSLTLTPNTQTADNAKTVTIALSVRDAFFNPVPNQNVFLSSSGTANTLSPSSGLTDSNGNLFSSQRSAVAETKTISATAGNLTLSQNATFTAGAASSANCLLTASPNGPLTADNNSFYTLLATVADAYGNRVTGQAVHLASTGNAVLSVTDGNTNNAGQFTSLLRSASSGTKTVSMTAGASSANALVSFVAGAPNATLSSLVLTPNTQVADNTQTIGIALSLRDTFGNGIANQNVSLSSSGTANTLSPSSGTTDSNGSLLSNQKSSVAEGKTIVATAGNFTLSQTATFAPGAASSTNCLISSSPNGPLTADNNNAYTLRVVVADAYGNRIQGQPVHLSTTGNAVLSTTDATTDSSGQLTSLLRSSVSGSKIVSMTAGAASASATLFFVAGSPNATLSTLSLTPNTQVADNVQTISIALQVVDDFNNAIGGQSVVLSASGMSNAFSPTTGNTNVAGDFTATVKSGVAGSKTVTATVGSSSLSKPVTFVAGAAASSNSTLSASPNGPVTADANSAYTVVATIADALGNRVSNQAVHLSVSGNAVLSAPDGNTDASGQFSSLLQSSLAATNTVSMTAGAASATLSLTFTAGSPSSANTTLSASPNSQVADNSNTIALSLLVRDAFNNPVSGQSVSLSATGGNNTFLSATGTTSPSGQYNTTLRSSRAQTKTVSATAAGATTSVAVTFVAGQANAMLSSLLASPNQSVTADTLANTNLLLSLRDSAGNPVNGVSVAWNSNDANVTLSPTSGVTDANGQLGTQARSSVAKTVALTAAYAGVSQAANVTFVAGNANAARSMLSFSPAGVADTSAVVTVLANWSDAFGNAVSNANVVFTASGSNVTLGPNVVATNTQGLAQTTVTASTAQTVTLSAAVGAQNLSGTVTFAPAVSSLVITPNTSLLARGLSSGNVTARLRKPDGSTAANVPIRIGTLGDEGLSFGGSLGTTNTSGTYTTTYRTNTAGPKTVVATIAGTSLSLPLSVNAVTGAGVNFIALPQYVSGVTRQAADVAFADVNKDGLIDSVMADYRTTNVVRTSLALMPGVLSTAAINSNTSGMPLGIALTDYTRDGNIDLVVSSVAPSTILAMPNTGGGSFALASNVLLLASSVSCNKVYAVDLNADGNPDIVSVCQEANGLRVHLSSGAGTFAAAVAYTVGGRPESASFVDFNGDGRLDVIVANSAATGPQLLLGGSGGTFGAASTVTLNANTLRVVPIDLNADGKLDLAFVSRDSAYKSRVGYALASAATTFSAAQSVASCYQPSALVAGAFTGAGNDLIVACNGGSQDSGRLYHLNGNSGLPSATLQNFSVGPGVTDAIKTNLNADAYADVAFVSATALAGTTTAPVILGSGQGLVTPQVVALSAPSVGAAGALRFIVLADVDGDGDLDAVTSNNTANAVDVSLNTNGKLGAPVTTSLSTSAFSEPSLADVDGDGILDLVVGNTASANITLWLGNGNGTFHAGPVVPTGFAASGALLGALDGDVFASLLVASGSGSTLQVWGNAGGANFRLEQTLFAYTGAGGLRLADFDGDGRADLYAFSPTGSMVWMGQGQGVFSPGQSVGNDAYSAPRRAAIADINQDGFDDLLLGAYGDLLLSQGTNPPTFTTTRLGVTSASPSFADLNGDGIADLILPPVGDSQVVMRLGVGDGTFGNFVSLFAVGQPGAVATGDLDGDGLADIVVASYGDTSATTATGDGNSFPAQLLVGLNKSLVPPAGGAMPQLALSVSPNVRVADGLQSMAVSVQVTDGNGVALSGNAVTFASSGGTLSVLSGATDSNGQASSALTSTSAQSVNLSASVGPAFKNTSVVFVAGSPNANKSSVAANPSSFRGTTSGSVSMATVHVADAFNNPLSGSVATLSLASGAYVGQSSCVLNASGNCSVRFSTASSGNQVLRVSVNGSVIASAGLSVAASPNAALSSLVASPSTGVLANGAATSGLTFIAKDDTGALVGSFPVNFTSSSVGAVLAPSASATDANGKAISTVQSDVSGTVQVRAIVDGMALSTNVTFVAGPLSAGGCLLSATPAAAVAGSTSGVALSFFAADGAGNPIAGQNVTFASPSGTLSAPSAITDGNGLASVRLTDATAEAVVVSAATGGVNKSLPVTFYAAQAAQSLVLVGPVGGPSPAASILTVSALDASGRRATGYTGTLHVTSSDANAVLPADYTFVSADAGQHTFATPVTLSTSGLQNITVRDVGNANLTATLGGLWVGGIDGNTYYNLYSSSTTDQLVEAAPASVWPGSLLAAARPSGVFGQTFAFAADGTIRQNLLCAEPMGGAGIIGRRVALATCRGAQSQQWAYKDGRLVWLQDANLCLDVPPTGGSAARLAGCQATTTQGLSLVTAAPHYKIASTQSFIAMDVASSSRAFGTALQSFYHNFAAGQAYTIDMAGAMSFRGVCADLNGSLPYTGAALLLNRCTGALAQQWGVIGSTVRPLADLNQCLTLSTSTSVPATLSPCAGLGSQVQAVVRTATLEALTPVAMGAISPVAIGFVPGNTQGGQSILATVGDLNASLAHSPIFGAFGSYNLSNYTGANLLTGQSTGLPVIAGAQTQSSFYQQWLVSYSPSGAANYFGNGTGLFLDATTATPGVGLVSNAPNNGNQQLFYTLPKELRVRPASNANLCLEVANGRVALSSSPLTFQTCADVPGQRFVPININDGQSAAFDFGLGYGTAAVNLHSLSAGEPLYLDSLNFIGGAVSRFTLGNGNQFVVANKTSMCIDAGSATLGTAPTIQACSSSASQAFLYSWGGPPNANRLSVTTPNATITASDSVMTNVTISLRDVFGYGVSNQPITGIAVTGVNNVLSATSGTTDVSGAFVVGFRSTKAEPKVLTAQSGNFALTGNWTVVPASPNQTTSTVSVVPATTTAADKGNITVTTVLNDSYSNKCLSVPVFVSLLPYDTQAIPPSGLTNGSGSFSTVVRSEGSGLRELALGSQGVKFVINPNFTRPTATCAATRTPLFSAPPAFAVTYGATTTTTADVNGDGNRDLIAAGYSGNPNLVNVVLSGGFGIMKSTVASNVTGCATIKNVVAADVNKDGRADAIFGCGSSNAVIVGISNTAGGFSSYVNLPVGFSADYVVTGDFNGDGNVDIVGQYGYRPYWKLYLGKGNGTFTSSVAMNTQLASTIIAVAVADVDGDGASDYAYVDNGGTGYLNTGSKTGSVFANSYSFGQSTVSATSVFLADVTGDGIPDAIFKGVYGINIGKGTGTLSNGGMFTNFVMNYVYSFNQVAPKIDLFDINGDGYVDIVLQGNNRIIPLYGNGTQTLTAGIAAENDWDDATLLAHADLNGDGRLDLMTFTDRRYQGFYTSSAGLLDSRPMISVDTPVSVQVVDFDLDGNQDILSLSSSGSVWLTRNLGNAVFATPTTIASGTSYSSGSVLASRPLAANLDFDGYPDLVVTTNNANAWVGFNSKNNTVSDTYSLGFGASGNAVWVDAQDVDADGNPDVVSAWGRSVFVTAGSSSHAFAAPKELPMSANVVAGAIGDVNLDGLADVVVASDAGTAYVLVNTGTSLSSASWSMTQASTFTLPTFPAYALRIVDISADGKPDVIALGSAPIIATGKGTGLFNAAATIASANSYSLPSNSYGWFFDVTDINGDGLLDFVGLAGNGVTVQINSGSNTFYGSEHPWAKGWQTISTGDLNNDGLPDIVTASGVQSRIGVFLQSTCR